MGSKQLTRTQETCTTTKINTFAGIAFTTLSRSENELGIQISKFTACIKINKKKIIQLKRNFTLVFEL